jgi:hypothetical protein
MNNSYTTNEAEAHMAGAMGAVKVVMTTKEVTDCTNCGEMNITDNVLCKQCRTVPQYQIKEWLSESLIDSTGMVRIGLYNFEPGRVLKTLDPIAYNEMYLDFCDSLARDGYIIVGYNDNE